MTIYSMFNINNGMAPGVQNERERENLPIKN